MAAGKTLRVKLRYRSRLSPPTSEFGLKHHKTIKELAMVSAPEDMDEPMMEPILGPLQTPFDHRNSDSIPPPAMMPLTSAAILSQRRRRKNSSSLKRSASTPNVRGMSNGEVGMTLAEKRRNKLGYHRTSVACGHCRRRKIRCLLAPDDTQNRCANCIRLKKDCSFFPVDQQPQMDRRPRASSRVDTRASNSSDSSPAMVGGHLLPHGEDFNSYPHVALAVPYSSTGAMGSELVSPMTRVPINTQTFELPPQQNRSSWGSPFPGDGPTSAGHSSPGDSNHAYWGTHAESPMTPGFSPHLSAPTSALHSASDARSSFTSFAPSRTHSDSTWAMPTRSMSFGLVEDLPQSYQNHYHNPQPLPIEYRRRASEMHMHPPSLQTSNNSSLATPPPGHMTPLSAPPVSSPPIQHWGIPTTWSTLPNSLVTKAPDYGSWYGETAPLAKVQEEDIAHFGSEPAILYAGEHH